ncbi:MAG TPA: NfeD family protein [Candidatus Thermoplasmatota archaeon]|nr:NfeD family protein [Candidatus Thermoplasmatota archaeon]
MVDMLGLSIFLIGIALIVLELTQPGYFIGVVGTVGVVVGLIQMAYPGFLLSWWSPPVSAAVALLASLAAVQFYKKFAPPARAPETLSSDGLIGKPGRVVTRVEPNNQRGKVKVGGIVWSAEAEDDTIDEGSDVVVTRVEGVHLVVKKGHAGPSEVVLPIPTLGGLG